MEHIHLTFQAGPKQAKILNELHLLGKICLNSETGYWEREGLAFKIAKKLLRATDQTIEQQFNDLEPIVMRMERDARAGNVTLQGTARAHLNKLKYYKELIYGGPAPKELTVDEINQKANHMKAVVTKEQYLDMSVCENIPKSSDLYKAAEYSYRYSLPIEVEYIQELDRLIQERKNWDVIFSNARIEEFIGENEVRFSHGIDNQLSLTIKVCESVNDKLKQACKVGDTVDVYVKNGMVTVKVSV